MKSKRNRTRNMGDEVIAALRETNHMLARGQKLNVRDVFVTPVPQQCSAREVQHIRDSLGCSQAAFAAFLGVPLATLSSWERGKRSPSAMARRFLNEMKDNPEYWRGRLTQSWRIAG